MFRFGFDIEFLSRLFSWPYKPFDALIIAGPGHIVSIFSKYLNVKLNLFSSRMMVIFSIVVIGLIVHGSQAGNLGLYWDDTEQFMRGMHDAGGNLIRFILSDTSNSLLSERPFAYLFFMIARAGFAVSISTLHWTLVGLFILNAIIITNIARKIVNENWFVFAVGIIFITYPLSPMQTIWPATVHYLGASLLALMTILFSLNGLGDTEKRLCWVALAAVAFISCILTHEEFLLIPPAVISLYMLSKDKQQVSGRQTICRTYVHKPAVLILGLFITIMIAYGLWRIFVFQIYGKPFYHNSQIVLTLGILVKKSLAGAHTVFLPWSDALYQVSNFPPPLRYKLLSMLLFVVTWLITVRLLPHSLSGRNSSLSELQAPINGHWLRAAITGIVLVIAAISIIGFSPGSINRIAGIHSRFNFVATIGVALGLPALLWLMVWAFNRNRMVSILIVLACFLYIGFLRFPSGVNIFSHRSTFPVLFGRYSLLYGSMIMAYVAGIALSITTLICGLTSPRRTNNRIESAFHLIAKHVMPGTIACIVLIGSLFHFSVTQQFIAMWDQTRTMFKQMTMLAPALEDDTFVVIVEEQPSDHTGKHYEISDFLRVLYDNPSLMGNTSKMLRFYSNRVESSAYGKDIAALTSYDHLLLFNFYDNMLHMLPDMEVKTEEGESLIVKSNPKRILNQHRVTNTVWQRIIEK